MSSPTSQTPASSEFYFFFLIRSPPTSTLFPYTTLFRSGDEQIASRRETILSTCVEVAIAIVLGALVSAATGIALSDRKSTRLNSSHMSISYAVFCLKKKNKKQRRLSEKDTNSKSIRGGV